MPYSYNLAIIITHGFSVGRYAGSVILFLHTPGVALAVGSQPRLGVGRSPKTEPRATGCRPRSGAFQSRSYTTNCGLLHEHAAKKKSSRTPEKGNGSKKLCEK